MVTWVRVMGWIRVWVRVWVRVVTWVRMVPHGASTRLHRLLQPTLIQNMDLPLARLSVSAICRKPGVLEVVTRFAHRLKQQ